MEQIVTKHRVNPDEWKQGLYESFDKVRQHRSPYEMRVGKFDIHVMPDVFSPKYFTDSLYFAEELTKIVGQKSLLEIGPGTGIISIYCADAGARVVAIDINSQAALNTMINANNLGVSVSTRWGDLYGALGPNEKFDYIFWNHPFNSWDEDVDLLMRAGVDPNYGDLRRYVRDAHLHLEPGGQLLLGSSDMAETQAIEQIAADYGYRLAVLAQSDMPIEEGHEVWNTYFIYRFDRR